MLVEGFFFFSVAQTSPNGFSGYSTERDLNIIHDSCADTHMSLHVILSLLMSDTTFCCCLCVLGSLSTRVNKTQLNATPRHVYPNGVVYV